jgi:hypothetical protein
MALFPDIFDINAGRRRLRESAWEKAKKFPRANGCRLPAQRCRCFDTSGFADSGNKKKKINEKSWVIKKTLQHVG